MKLLFSPRREEEQQQQIRQKRRSGHGYLPESCDQMREYTLGCSPLRKSPATLLACYHLFHPQGSKIKNWPLLCGKIILIHL